MHCTSKMTCQATRLGPVSRDVQKGSNDGDPAIRRCVVQSQCDFDERAQHRRRQPAKQDAADLVGQLVRISTHTLIHVVEPWRKLVDSVSEATPAPDTSIDHGHYVSTKHELCAPRYSRRTRSYSGSTSCGHLRSRRGTSTMKARRQTRHSGLSRAAGRREQTSGTTGPPPTFVRTRDHHQRTPPPPPTHTHTHAHTRPRQGEHKEP